MMTTDQKRALAMAEDAAMQAVRKHDEARREYLKALFSDGLEAEQERCRKDLREAALVLECTGMALRNAMANAGMKVH